VGDRIGFEWGRLQDIRAEVFSVKGRGVGTGCPCYLRGRERSARAPARTSEPPGTLDLRLATADSEKVASHTRYTHCNLREPPALKRGMPFAPVMSRGGALKDFRSDVPQ